MKYSKYLFALLIVFLIQSVNADILLPLTTVRDQSDTSHCWAYSSSHLLESRSLIRDGEELLINVEKDVKYWVDYERMMYNFREKKDFYLGEDEGGWQIEFMETLFKHGKNLKRNQKIAPIVSYEPMKDFLNGLPFIEEPRPAQPIGLLPMYEITDKMHQFTNEQEAHDFAIGYLNQYYGQPLEQTQWDKNDIPLVDSAKFIFGTDFGANNSVDAIVLVKPVYDGQYGWTKYLEGRYWGYRYDYNNILSLIETSLNNNWPVSFDNVYHAMTIVGYATGTDGVKYYAVANSVPGVIEWYSEKSLLSQLNLVTFFKQAITGALPARAEHTRSQIKLADGLTIDQYDNVTTPPR